MQTIGKITPLKCFMGVTAMLVLSPALLPLDLSAATTYVWTGAGGNALWANSANWTPAGVPGSADTASFTNAAGAGGTVIDLGSGVSVSTISFVGPNCDAYTIGAGGANAQSLTLTGAGNAGLSASGSGFSKQITINAAITINNSQQWVLSQGANPYIINGNVAPNGTAGTTKYIKINGHGCAFSGVLADQTGGALLQISGANGQTATLTNPNSSFTGGLDGDNGSVSVNSLGLIGTSSAGGAGGLITLGSGFGGGVLVYTGPGDTTDRIIRFNNAFQGASITQSGASGLLKLIGNLDATNVVGTRTLTLSGSTAGTAEYAGVISDNGTTGTTGVKTAGAGVTVLTLNSVDGITVGSAISGTGIPLNATVTGVTNSNRTIGLSAATTASPTQISNSGVKNVTYLTKSGSGTWTLSGTNTYSGPTWVTAGLLVIGSSQALQNSPLDTVNGATGNATVGLKTALTTLTLGGLIGTSSPKNLAALFTTSSGGYSGVTALTLNPTAGATYNGAPYNYSGVVADGAVGMSLTKTGAGTQILSGTNTYTGSTTISSGTLVINGSLAPASAVTVVNGGTLAGTGTVPGVVTNNGIIAPGGLGSLGRLTVTNLLTGAGVINFDLTSPATAGVTYDQINGGGTLQVVLSGPTAIQLNPTTGGFTNGNYYLITNTASLAGGQFVMTNGLTLQTNGAKLLTLLNSSSGLVLNVTDAAPPTQLAFTGVPVNPQVNLPFSVTVTAQDGSGAARAVTNDTTVTLSRTSGTGTLSGTLSGVIPAGSSSVTIATPIYDTAETMTLAATATAGMTTLTPAGTSITFVTLPTKLAITSVNGGANPYAGTAFNVVVQSQDGTSVARNVVSNTVVSLSVNTGTSAYLNTPLTGTIPAGANSVTLSNVIYSQPGTGISLTATRTSGDNLTAGTSANFNVLANTNKDILTFTFPGYGAATIAGTNISIILPVGTVVTNLAPTYTVSSFAAGSPVSGTALDFSNPQTYIITAQDGSQHAYLVTVNLVSTTSFFWTNSVSDNWSSAINWTNDFGWTGAPTNTGAATYALNFNQAGTYTTTNDLANGFLLNQLNFGGPTLTLAGNALAFANNSVLLPQIKQNSSAAVAINNNLTLATNTTVGGAGSGAVTLNGLISGPGSLTKTCSGNLTFNNITSTYSGGTVLSAGNVTHAYGAGATTVPFGTGPVTLNSNATFSLNRTVLTNQLILNGGTLSGGGGWPNNLLGGLMTLQATSAINMAFPLSIANNITGPGGLLLGGNTTVTLTGSNSFTGSVAINAGNLNVASLNSVSGGKPTSNLGAPTNAAGGTISLGATTTTGNLNYTGPGETTDRIIQLLGTTGGAIITQQGTAAGLPLTQNGQSGLLKFTSDVSIPGVANQDNRKTLTLTSAEIANNGFVCGQGEISGSIGDSVLGNAGQLATSLTKAGYGTWTLSGANTYSGTTAIQAGKLICTRATALGSGPLVITDADIVSQLQLNFPGFRQVAGLTINGVVKPNGTYGSSSSLATTKDDVHFAGPGVVVVGSLSSATTSTLALTGGSNPSAGGAALTFTATVTGGNSPSGSVVFYDGVTPLGTNVLNGSAQATFTTSLLPGGSHAITALYPGNSSNAPSASAVLTQTVNDSRPATTVTLGQTAGANPSSLGAPVTYTATVTGATPTGTVVFYNGITAIGSAALSAGQASLTTGNLPSGWDGLSANYLGDANNAPGTSAVIWQTVKPPAGNGKLKVFILAGQSNMQGKGEVENGGDPNNPGTGSVPGGLGSLRGMLNGNTNRYGYLVDTNGYANTSNTTVPGWRTLTNVWVSYFTSGATASTNEARKGYLDADFGDGSSQGRIGPEYGFGLVMGSQLGDPVLIIKTAWGGNSLAWNFRPPSSGTNVQQNGAIGTMGDAYSNMVANVHFILNNLTNELTNFSYNATSGYELVGFGWHQGWNDIGEPELQYETNLVNFIHDVRAEFGVPNLPFVIDTTGMSSASGNQLLICAAQAAVANPVLHPELAGTVFTVDTRYFDYGLLMGPTPSQGYHWYHNAQSYFNIGQSMGLGMLQLLSAQPSVTNQPASTITTNSAALNASVTWPFTPCTGVAYWDTVDHGTNAGAWPHSAVVNTWFNSIPTNQYGVVGDYVLTGGTTPLIAATNLSFTATGLLPNTTYYFNFAATNQTVSDLSLTNTLTLWATNTLSFTTAGQASPPPAPVLPPGGVTLINGVPSFSFQAAAGVKYRLDYKNLLTDANWSYGPWTTNTSANAQQLVLSDPSAVGQPQRFYRLEAAWP